MLATFILNILEYIRKTLNIRPLIQLYCQLLDHSNITYIVIQIIPKSKFWGLNFFISDINGVNAIKKTRIFINNIFEDIEIAKYLRFLLFAKLEEKSHQIIQILYSMFETNIKTILLKNFLNKDI